MKCKACGFDHDCHRADCPELPRNKAPHTCHWPGCRTVVAPKLWGCRSHWYLLPPLIRLRITRAYRRGQEIDKRPSEEYLAAARAAQDWIRDREQDRQRAAGAGG